MLRRELIFLHSASGDGCNDRPLLLATQEDFYRPVCIGSTRTFCVAAFPFSDGPHLNFRADCLPSVVSVDEKPICLRSFTH